VLYSFCTLFWLFWGAKKGSFLGSTQKKSDDGRGAATSDRRNASRLLVLLAHNPLSPDRDFFGHHPKKVPLNKTFRNGQKKCIFLRVIRTELGTLGLGRNSGTSGDFQLTRSSQQIHFGVHAPTIAEDPSRVNVDVRRSDRRRSSLA
jgi:hypothetical protein